MQRNTVQFGDHPDRTITLVAQGSLWPTAVEVDGESWERTDEVVEVGRAETVRVYQHVGEQRRTG